MTTRSSSPQPDADAKTGLCAPTTREGRILLSLTETDISRFSLRCLDIDALMRYDDAMIKNDRIALITSILRTQLAPEEMPDAEEIALLADASLDMPDSDITFDSLEGLADDLIR